MVEMSEGRGAESEEEARSARRFQSRVHRGVRPEGPRRSWLREASLGVLVLSVLLPVIRCVPLTLLRWSDRELQFVGPLSWRSYSLFFQGYRGGVVLQNLLLATYAVLAVAALTTPIVLYLKYRGEERLLSIVEILLVVPFLFSPALRLFALRDLLGSSGLVGGWLLRLGASRHLVSNLIFSDTGIVLGLVASYAALFVLPLIQVTKQVEPHLVEAGRDIGLVFLAIARRLLLPLAWRGVLAGALLMLSVAWFSSLEADVLGKRESVVGMLRGMLAVKKYSETLAFAVITFALSLIVVALLVIFGRPERLIFPAEDK